MKSEESDLGAGTKRSSQVQVTVQVTVLTLLIITIQNGDLPQGETAYLSYLLIEQ